jgi:hypothetical protein
MPRRAELGRVPLRGAAEAMGGRVILSVGFRLYDETARASNKKACADQPACKSNCAQAGNLLLKGRAGHDHLARKGYTGPVGCQSR